MFIVYVRTCYTDVCFKEEVRRYRFYISNGKFWLQVPALILQPFIENSIWHGIMPKHEEGHVKVTVEKSDDIIFCIIDDNGIGRDQAMKNRFKHQASTHQSKGVNLTQSRLDLDNALNNRSATVQTIDKKDERSNALGTTVILTFKED